MQLPLQFRLNDDATFDTFVAGKNAQVVHWVKEIASGREQFAYLHGVKGTGKTHLLQAACHRMGEQAQSAVYIPLAEYREYGPQMLEGLEALALVCIDDVDAVAGHRDWEEALMDLYNCMRAVSHGLLVAGDKTPRLLGLSLPDLESRFNWGMVFELQPLDDEQMLASLRHRAKTRGLELTDEVGRFLLKQAPRSMPQLNSLFETLDQASLREQRKLTIPFVKKTLQW